MYENSNKATIQEIAAENFKIHKLRNGIAALAIMLTAMLITIVCTSGIGMYQAVSGFWDAAPGPGADGMSVTGTEAQYEQMKQLPQVEWAAIARPCSATAIHNAELLGKTVKLFAVDEDYYDKNFVVLEAGSLPTQADEMLLSDTLADYLGIEKQPGTKMTLNVVMERNGEEIEQPIDMTISGYYNNPLRSIADYEELYTVRDFLMQYNPEMLNGKYTIYVKLNNLDPFKLGSDKEEKLMEIKEAVGAEAISYKMGNMSALLLLPYIGFLVIVILSGYFLIYNVFYLSIVNEIRFYGMLKTIGTTGKQLKYLIRYQINRLAIVGIAIGLMVGFLFGNVMTPFFLAYMRDGYVDFYQTPNPVLIAVISALFAYLTVIISSRKPLKIASGISPIEASGYTGKRKKAVVSVISFALSGVIFLVVCNITMGYDIHAYARRYIQADMQIDQIHARQPMEEAYVPITGELVNRLENLSFVERTDIFYNVRTAEFTEGAYSSRAELRFDGKIKQEMEATVNDEFMLHAVNERGNIQLGVVGMPWSSLEKEMQFCNILDGVIDPEKFASGNYILYQNKYKYYAKDGAKDNRTIHADDIIDIGFYIPETGNYVEKSYQVMAVLDNRSFIYGGENILSGSFVLPDTEIIEIYPDAGEMISRIMLTVKPGDSEAQQEQVKKLMLSEYNFQLEMDTWWDELDKGRNNKATMSLIGLFLSAVFGIIGAVNVINTLVTDVLARKIEYAGMQSVGMTKRQLFVYLMTQCLKLCAASLILMIPAGMYMAKIVANGSTFTGFSASAYAQGVCIMAAAAVGISLGVSIVMVRVLNRKSIVERLRESE